MAAHTREAMLVLEAAGHDVVIVETVGVGQSETAVAGMTDCFALLQLPNAGDDLQAIKRGVMELADLVAINKADLDAAAATRAQAQITSSLRLMQHGGHQSERDEVPWQSRVLTLSAITGNGLAEFWQAVSEFRDQQTASGRLAARRHEQDEAWMWERIEALLHERFRAQPAGGGGTADAHRRRASRPRGGLGGSAATDRPDELIVETEETSSCTTYSSNSRRNAVPRAWAAARSASTHSTPRASSPRASAWSCCSTRARSRSGTCSSSTAAPTSAWPTTRCRVTAWSPATA